MVRRGDTSDEEPASSPPATQFKAEKTKNKGKAREENEEGSAKGAKRARTNEGGDSVPRDEEDEQREHEDGAEPPKRVKTLPRDVDGFIPGSIVRITLRNFVTYDAVSFRPGPFLNMILGPNGTGKSSIACAICLGLNWPPKILGRADHLNAFVKIGAADGFIEIELKGPARAPNLVIRRNLSATAKTSTFTLNKKSASGAEVAARVAQLNVQCGNLCSFLPQDKVSEFAAMTPVQLLRETQRAAGDPRLTQWHETLISEGTELKKITNAIKTETASMVQLQERNENIERDVQRYRERKKIEHSIAMLKVLIPVQHYREARIHFIELKARQRAQHYKVSKLQEKNKPAHALLVKLDRQYTEMNQDREASKKALRAALAKVEKRTQASEELEGACEDQQTKLIGLKKAEKNRLNTIKKCQADIADLEAELQEDVKLEDTEALKTEGRNLQSAFDASSYAADARAHGQRENVLEERKRMNNRNREDGQRQLKSLDDLESVKLNNLSRWDRDVGDAVRWLRQNKDKFRMEVFEPPALSITVPNQSFAAGVESCFNQAQMKMFVCQCKEDYETLNSAINDNQGLGRRARVAVWFRPGTKADLNPPPLSDDELRRFNFDGYAIDYVQCAEGLRWFLMRELNMHRTAISLKGVRDIAGAIETVARPGPNGRSQNTNFVDAQTVHQVSRSKYGQRKISSSAQPLNQPRNFDGRAQVNPADTQRIDDILKHCKQEEAEMAEEHREVEAEGKRLGTVKEEFERKKNGIRKRMNVIKSAAEKKEKIKIKLRNIQRTLDQAQKKGDAVQEGARIRAKILEISKKRIQLVAEAVDLTQDVIKEQIRGTQLGLQSIQIGAKKAALKELCDRKDAKYQLALAEFNKIDAEFEKLKVQTKTLLEQSKELLEELPEEMREEYQETESARIAYEKAVAQAKKDDAPLPEPDENVDLRSMEELQTELEKQEANLEMNMNTNPGVVEQYEKRKRDIEVLQNTIEGRKRQADKMEAKIKTARDNWEPALQELVASIGKKFSAAFDRIGCAGEIRVRPEEAYDQWAIDILVKFRDTEKLQLLTGQRQSGGERSLTTILYLMSLTEEARAPFSLVDEINQGMDQRAERMVHNSMVEVTCKPDSAQYFLITPKLLPDLEYHERMKILCVNNGEWLPEETGLGNMMSMIDGFVAKNGG
ncbi:P-loop containing nucleoside triphosphate hydrolase protein [Mycena belliarum]|uniref:Structural maintenance of chromosomes protein 5 n=1 Tax=Mycena belliarum TaxID=1033014 RepID=A0AAD6UF78_9AGAR|nr:P-loop containing nucleoside triphosphate hydrolase protein [Mycena belliae]